jgi:GT2 family glycosyltransferase
MKNKIGIILINYKDYANKYLLACRDSLRVQDYGIENFQVYIIDNSSTKESSRLLKDLYPEAIIISRSDGNYCAANNIGFKQAIIDGCDYLVTLNMDTEVKPDWLRELSFALDSDLSVGIAQSKILLFPHKDQNQQDREEKGKKELEINTLGNILHFLGFGTTSFYRQSDKNISGYPEITGYASGCCFITKKQVFEKIEGWNEEYYMYHDDIEFSLKTRLVGYKIILAPKSVVFHKYEFFRSLRGLYFMERNRYLLIFSFYPHFLIIFLLPLFLLLELSLMLFSVFKGWFGIWFRARLYFLKFSSWRKIFKFRQKIKKIQKVSFLRIADQMAGKLEFLEIDNFVLHYIANPLLNFYWQIIKRII